MVSVQAETRGRECGNGEGENWRLILWAGCRKFGAVLPHPIPLPLGEGVTTTASGKIEEPQIGVPAADVRPRPAGEGWGEGERRLSSHWANESGRLRVLI